MRRHRKRDRPPCPPERILVGTRHHLDAQRSSALTMRARIAQSYARCGAPPPVCVVRAARRRDSFDGASRLITCRSPRRPGGAKETRPIVRRGAPFRCCSCLRCPDGAKVTRLIARRTDSGWPPIAAALLYRGGVQSFGGDEDGGGKDEGERMRSALRWEGVGDRCHLVWGGAATIVSSSLGWGKLGCV